MVSIVILIVLIRLFSETPKIDSIVMGLFRLLKNKIIPNYSSAEYYNTTAKRQKWFNNLEDEWKILFKFQLQDFNEMISDEAINTIFSKKELEINLDGYKNLSGLRNLTNLKVLTIHNYSNTDLSDLKGLKNLRAIKIYHTNFSNGIPIGILSTITHLALHNCEIESLYDFNHLPKLEMLILDNNRITTINSLKKLTKLSYLSLCNNPIDDFKTLKELPQTEIILHINQKYDLHQLSQLGLNIKLEDTNYKTYELN